MLILVSTIAARLLNSQKNELKFVFNLYNLLLFLINNTVKSVVYIKLSRI